MIVYYDRQVDAATIRLSNKEPEGVVEISECANLNVCQDCKIIGIEILNAAEKINLKSLFTFEADEASFASLGN